ncbi:MAG: hypothetical protein IPN70_00875 [Candidatus Moraniibacteriota bacterium]|nr:MAG: hypothetical protein IPN70_00875 [Candidatus Moranbacteria bacterium]
MTNIGSESLLRGMRNCFSILHSVVTGSQKIIQLSNVSIHEENIPEKGKVNFYFFHGAIQERKKFFPHEDSAYCSFHPNSLVTSAFVNGRQKDFPCEFGYILHPKEIVEEFRFTDGSLEALESMAIQIASHEIRHEIQLHHSLDPLWFRRTFPPIKISSEILFDWRETKKNMKFFYDIGYVQRGLPSPYLEYELDAIITSYLSLAQWYRDDRSEREKFEEIAQIIWS